MNDADIKKALTSGRGPAPKSRIVPTDQGQAPEEFHDVAFDRTPAGVWVIGKAPRPRMGDHEEDEQARLFAWLRGPGRILGLRSHSTPNDGAGSRERMVALKRTGLTKGVCDLYVMGPGGNLAIEMKRECGKLSDVSVEQWDWLEGLVPLPSWTACVCFGYEAARAALGRFKPHIPNTEY